MGGFPPASSGFRSTLGSVCKHPLQIPEGLYFSILIFIDPVTYLRKNNDFDLFYYTQVHTIKYPFNNE